jgi:hypothetical protein
MFSSALNDNDPISNDAIDSCAQLIAYQVENDVIRDGLLARGMSPYQAFLCYKAAQMLLSAGFYDRSSRVVIPD